MEVEHQDVAEEDAVKALLPQSGKPVLHRKGQFPERTLIGQAVLLYQAARRLQVIGIDVEPQDRRTVAGEQPGEEPWAAAEVEDPLSCQACLRVVGGRERPLHVAIQPGARLAAVIGELLLDPPVVDA